MKRIYKNFAYVWEMLGTFFMVKGYLDKNVFYLGLMIFFMLWGIIFTLESYKNK